MITEKSATVAVFAKVLIAQCKADNKEMHKIHMLFTIQGFVARIVQEV